MPAYVIVITNKFLFNEVIISGIICICFIIVSSAAQVARPGHVVRAGCQL